MISTKHINQITNSDFEVIEMRHAFRLNGCVDVYKSGNTLFDKVKKEYIRNLTENQLIEKAFYLAHSYGKKDAFKKTQSGRMSYKEFRNRSNSKNQISSIYHWNNNKLIEGDYLYFIKAGTHVKIGRSKDPEKRLKEIQTGTPNECSIWIKVKGRGHMEKKLHSCFSEFKVRHNGEWFFISEEIRSFVLFLRQQKIKLI